MPQYEDKDPNKHSTYYAEIQKMRSSADLQKFLDKVGEPKNLTEVAARMEAKAHAMEQGFAPPAPPLQQVHDPLNDENIRKPMPKLHDLFQKSMDIKLTNATAEHISSEMSESAMRREALQNPNLNLQQKREICRELDVFKVKHGDLEDKLSMLVMKFEDAKFMAIKRDEIGQKAQNMAAAGLPIPDNIQKIIKEGEQRASYTMEDLQQVLPAADLMKEREGFINYGTPTKDEQDARGNLYDRAVKRGDKPKFTRDEYIFEGAPSEAEKKERAKIFDAAIEEIKDYGRDIGREAEVNKLLEPDKKTSAVTAPENNVAMASMQPMSPTALRSGAVPTGPKSLA